MLQSRSTTFWCILCIGLLSLLFLNSRTQRPLSHYSVDIFGSYSVPSSSPRFQSVGNSTLGFEKVFAVGLPERSDKRDALALISSLTGFKIDWINGVRGEDVVNKALPFGVDRVKLWENNLGSWRGHMNAIRTIVERGYSTALIMEDDMDWDVRIKSQLLEIAKGARYFQPSSQIDYSPYGDDWDVLWLGHCGEVFPETLEEYRNVPATDSNIVFMSRKYTISSDKTVPPPDKTHGFQNYTENPFTRWVHISGGPICSFAYALSQRGARKVLYDLSVDHLVGPFDNALAGLCRWGRDESRLGMRCYTVTPPVFFHHKAKGPTSSDSDIQNYGGKGEIREKGWTDNVVWSARGNIRNLIIGGKMESQFEETL